MGQLASTVRRWVRSFSRDERGSSTIPFILMFPMFVVIMMSSIEMGVLMLRQVMLERGLDMTVRDLRLATWTPTNSNDPAPELKARICNYAGIIPKCTSTLMVQLQPISKTTWQPLASAAMCVDRSKPVNVNPTPDFGSSNQMMMVRACVKFDPIFPTTGAGFHLPKDNTGAYTIVSSSAFVNEPRPGS